MEKVTSQLKRRIMYRVYMVYGLSIFSHRFFWRGIIFGASLALFGRLVHVASVTNNLLETPLGQVPRYVTLAFSQAMASGEFMTVALTFLLIGIGVSAMRAFAKTMIVPVLFKTA